VTRRTLIAAAGATPLAAQSPVPVIDTHIHLFDPTRPQGVPWPPKSNTLIYKPTYPSHFRALATKHGVVGAVMVECSPLFEDNQWVLDVIAKDTVMTGMIGNLEPADKDFGKQLEGLRKNPLYLGIRYGDLWGRSIHAQSTNPAFLAGLKELASHGLVLDTANPKAELMEDILRISDKIPNLRIVIDHLPKMEPQPGDATLAELHKRPQIFVKISAVLRKSGDKVPQDVAFYKDRLDRLFAAFGEDRVLYGSDWPNSEPLGTYSQVFGIVQRYFSGKGAKIAEKYFFRNSQKAYRWIKRDPKQTLA